MLTLTPATRSDPTQHQKNEYIFSAQCSSNVPMNKNSKYVGIWDKQPIDPTSNQRDPHTGDTVTTPSREALPRALRDERMPAEDSMTHPQRSPNYALFLFGDKTTSRPQIKDISSIPRASPTRPGQARPEPRPQPPPPPFACSIVLGMPCCSEMGVASPPQPASSRTIGRRQINLLPSL